MDENIALTSLHTLFLREHNRLARQLKRLNRNWDSETIYQETRKIMGAYTQVGKPLAFPFIFPSPKHAWYPRDKPLCVSPRCLCSGTICHTSWVMTQFEDSSAATQATIPTLTPVFPMSLRQQPTGSPTWPSSRHYPVWMETSERTVSSPVSPCTRPSSLPGGSFLRVSIVLEIAICHLSYVLKVSSYFSCCFVSPGGIDPLLRGLIGRPAKLNTQDHMMVDALRERLFQFVQHLALDLGSLNMQRGRDHGLPGTTLTVYQPCEYSS